MVTRAGSWVGSLACAAAALAFGLTLVACEDAAPPPKTPNDAATGTATTVPQPGAGTASTVADGPAGPDSAPVSIDERIRKMCDLPVANFDFDSAQVGAGAEQALTAIANCFRDGPGKGKGLRIVGHADPRGETTYNFALGQQRAGSIAEHLSRRGIDKARIATSSRGELEATGTDDASWARDRKVEIYLAE